jgi:histidine triad (HIT) family protein
LQAHAKKFNPCANGHLAIWNISLIVRLQSVLYTHLQTILRDMKKMASNCLFCKIAAGEIPSATVYSDDTLFAFRDINPIAPQHILLIPRKHITSVATLEDGDLLTMGQLMLQARKIAEQEGFAVNGFRCVLNTGDDGGQTVAHLHLHLLGGRQLAWPPG